jgi:hypothetical protein
MKFAFVAAVILTSNGKSKKKKKSKAIPVTGHEGP